MFIFRRSSSCADFKGKYLPSLNDYWGKHCALITSVDKPSRVQVGQLGPYPTLPYPTLPYTTPNPTLPLPIPLPYHTLPYPTPTVAPTPRYTTPPYPTPTIPYPTPTIPFPINMASLPFKRPFFLIWNHSIFNNSWGISIFDL